jgi:hypothetical protein
VELLRTYSNFELPVDLPKLMSDLAHHRRSEADPVAQPRKAAPSITSDKRAQILELYSTSKLAREIADLLGIGKTSVLRILHQEGMPIRPRGRPPETGA